jgi:hypothetical protein
VIGVGLAPIGFFYEKMPWNLSHHLKDLHILDASPFNISLHHPLPFSQIRIVVGRRSSYRKKKANKKRQKQNEARGFVHQMTPKKRMSGNPSRLQISCHSFRIRVSAGKMEGGMKILYLQMIMERYQKCLPKFLEPNLCFVVFNYKKEVKGNADFGIRSAEQK